MHTFHSPGGDFVLWVAGKVCQNQVKLSVLCLTLSDCVMSLWDIMGPVSNSSFAQSPCLETDLEVPSLC